MREEIIKNVTVKKLTSRQLIRKMHIKGEEEQAAFFSALNELEEEGILYQDESGFYQIFDEKRIGRVQGVVHITKTGYGIVKITSEGKKRKFLLRKHELNGALDGDIVVLTDLKKGSHNYEMGRVERIIKRSQKTIFEYIGKGIFVPHGSSSDIGVICNKKSLEGIVEGHLVLMRVSNHVSAIAPKKIEFDDESMAAIAPKGLIFDGEIDRIVGHIYEPDIEMKAIAESKGFHLSFSKRAMKELEAIPDEVMEEELEGRVDLRGERIFTIDGKDTKDMDDAIGIRREGKNYVVTVNIAHVSHYVKEGSALDEEARARGTSLYMADSVIPMLPPKLSNGICSLNPNVDRLTYTYEMTVDPKGNLISDDIYRSVIRSRKKMNYDDVNSILLRGIVTEGYEEYLEDLRAFEELTIIRQMARRNNGNIDFASSEVKIHPSEDDANISFEPRTQRIAENIVEELMILANTVIAERAHYLDQEFIYRVHGRPHEDGLVETLKFLKEEGLCNGNAVKLINKINNGTYTGRDLAEFLDSYKGTPDYPIISHHILTNMDKAAYSCENYGHFGLGEQYYSHNTSPIRRYPDLADQRKLDRFFEAVEANKVMIQQEGDLPEISAHSSYMERQADAAELEHLELMMAKYAKQHVGEPFRGQIICMTPYGMEVKLQNNVRGYVSPGDVSRAKRKLNRTFKLGSNICVLIKDVSIPHRAIYLRIVENPENRPKTKKLQLNPAQK